MTRPGFVLLLTLLIPASAAAWTKGTDERIARKAALLAPTDLKTLINKFEPEYLQGVDRSRSEGELAHRFDGASGSRLAQRIDAEARMTIAMIRKREPMAEVVGRLGVLAHLVGDANNPFHAATDERLLARRDDYETYAARVVMKVPTIFYGIDRDLRPSFVIEQARGRSARFAPLLLEEYYRGGQRRTSAQFDDRSTAFGIASIAYSRSVSDLINLYYFIWKEAGGDVRSARTMRPSNLLLNAN